MKIAKLAGTVGKLKGNKILSVSNIMKLRNKSDVFVDFINTIDENSSLINKNGKIIAEGISKGRKSFKDNKSIVKFLKEFYDTVELDVLMEVIMTFGNIIASGINTYRSLRNLNENTPIDKFIPLSECGDMLDHLSAKKLYESNQLQMEEYEEIKDITIKRVLDNEDKQFKFESGHYMEALNSDNLSDLKFSLRWHKNNTSNFDEFLESVSEFLKGAECKLTDSDIKRLSFHYSKH